jgi:hypothetical protein
MRATAGHEWRGTSIASDKDYGFVVRFLRIILYFVQPRSNVLFTRPLLFSGGGKWRWTTAQTVRLAVWVFEAILAAPKRRIDIA